MANKRKSSIVMTGNEKIAKLKHNLEEVKKRKSCIVLMSNDTGMDTTKVVYIDYVGERWAKGYTYVHLNNNTIQEVPETINYADIFNSTGGLNMEIIFPDFIKKEMDSFEDKIEKEAQKAFKKTLEATDKSTD